jgi:hypothetical protein
MRGVGAAATSFQSGVLARARPFDVFKIRPLTDPRRKPRAGYFMKLGSHNTTAG